MTERELILIVLGAATIGTAVALYRQGALRTGGFVTAVLATLAVVSFLIFTHS